jgi:hypothetical protein
VIGQKHREMLSAGVFVAELETREFEGRIRVWEKECKTCLTSN